MRARNKITGLIITIDHIDKTIVYYYRELTDDEKRNKGFSKYQCIVNEYPMDRAFFDSEYKIIEE